MSAAGALAPVGSALETASGFGFAVSPDGRFAYFATTGGSEGVFSVAADGSLTSLGTGFGSGVYGDIAITPDGRHLFAADHSTKELERFTIGADGSLTSLGTAAVPLRPDRLAVSPDGRFLYYQYFNGEVHEEGIGAAELGADGTPTPTSTFAPFSIDDADRLVFAPDPTPTAAFGATPGAPGAATSFDASASVGAVRYDWDFGDGTALEDGGPTPSHVYASPGTYAATLKVTDANGCSSEQIYTGQSTTCPGGAAATATNAVQIATPVITNAPPSLTALRVTNRRFAVKAKKGKAKSNRRTKHSTTFGYRLSEPAKVTFTIERKVLGRRVGGKCKHRTRGNSDGKKCLLRFRRVGSSFSRAGRQGGNGHRFAGKVPRASGKGKLKLKPGAYRVTALATDADGARSQPRRASFGIIAG